MTETQLIVECMPQVEEMTMEIQKMESDQYQKFKREHLEEVSRTCPRALAFMKKIYGIIEQSLGIQGTY